MSDADLLADLNALLAGKRNDPEPTGDGSGGSGSGSGSGGDPGSGGGGAGGGDTDTSRAISAEPVDEAALVERLRALETQVNAPFSA